MSPKHNELRGSRRIAHSSQGNLRMKLVQIISYQSPASLNTVSFGHNSKPAGMLAVYYIAASSVRRLI